MILGYRMGTMAHPRGGRSGHGGWSFRDIAQVPGSIYIIDVGQRSPKAEAQWSKFGFGVPEELPRGGGSERTRSTHEVLQNDHGTIKFTLWRGPGCKSFQSGFHGTAEFTLLCGFGDKSYRGVVFKDKL